MTRGTITKDPTIEVYISDETEDPVSELQYFICKCSEASFDPGTNQGQMFLEHVVITLPILESMIELLNLPLAKDPSSTGNEESKWICVLIKDCEFAQRDVTTSHAEEEDYCTVDDIHRLFSAVADRALSLKIKRSPTIVSGFLSRYIHFEASCLEIDQEDELSARQYVKLGDMIERSVHLTKLHLHLPFLNGASELFPGFACTKIEDLSLRDCFTQDVQRNYLGDVAVRPTGVIGSVRSLEPLRLVLELVKLLAEQYPLKKLSLYNMGLADHHMIFIWKATTLRSPKVEVLNFAHNLIQLPGMLKFANILPRMYALKHVDFRSNCWEDSGVTDDDRFTVGAALLHGLMKNTWLESMHGMTSTPQAPLLWHYVALNRAGRRILTSSRPIPDGLWAFVLERAGSTRTYWGDNPVALDMENTRKCSGEANSIFYFLQKCPKILAFI